MDCFVYFSHITLNLLFLFHWSCLFLWQHVFLQYMRHSLYVHTCRLLQVSCQQCILCCCCCLLTWMSVSVKHCFLFIITLTVGMHLRHIPTFEGTGITFVFIPFYIHSSQHLIPSRSQQQLYTSLASSNLHQFFRPYTTSIRNLLVAIDVDSLVLSMALQLPR